MRNPKWHRDEIILALDLYFKLEPGQIHARNQDVIELSDTLNQLPIHEFRPDAEKFRNPNGVGLKLSNFLAIDPSYDGKGMESYSKLDEEVFFEFAEDKNNLRSIANRKKATVSDQETNIKLISIEEDEDISVKEGKVIYRLHKLRERDQGINRKKKEKYFKENGKLDCEVCGFDFADTYGELGKGYIECHHRIPLSELEPNSTTSLDDLALVCANCHRMLHREINTLSTESLRSILSNG